MTSLLKCPYCGEKAISKAMLGNSFYILSNDKKCKHCEKPLKLNWKGFFLYYFGIGIISIVAIILYSSFIFEPCKNNFITFNGDNSLLCSYLIIPFIILFCLVYYFVIFGYLKVRMFRKIRIK